MDKLIFTHVKQDSEIKYLQRFWLKKFDTHFHYCRRDSSIYGSPFFHIFAGAVKNSADINEFLFSF